MEQDDVGEGKTDSVEYNSVSYGIHRLLFLVKAVLMEKYASGRREPMTYPPGIFAK